MLLLYVAMFLPEKLSYQLMTFLLSSLVALGYLLYVRPFTSSFENHINVANESVMLFVVYLLTCVASFPLSSTEIGTLIVKVIWASWALNGIVVLYLIADAIYSKLRRLYLLRKAKKQRTKSQNKERERRPSTVTSAFKS